MCCPGILIFVHIWNEKRPHDSAKLRCFPNKCSWNKFWHHKLTSSATRKCRRPLTYNCGVCRRASGAAPGAPGVRPWPDAAFPGAGAARSPNERLISAVRRRADSEATPGPRARAHAQLQHAHEPRMHNAMSVRVHARGCARACTGRTAGAGPTRGHSRMQLTGPRAPPAAGSHIAGSGVRYIGL